MEFITEPSANRIKETSGSAFFPEEPPRVLAGGGEPQRVPVKLLALHTGWSGAAGGGGLRGVPADTTPSVCPGLKQGEPP